MYRNLQSGRKRFLRNDFCGSNYNQLGKQRETLDNTLPIQMKEQSLYSKTNNNGNNISHLGYYLNTIEQADHRVNSP